MLGLCWGSALPSAMDNEIPSDFQEGRLRGETFVVEAQSCPTWYRKTKHNGVTRCVCGDTIHGDVICDDASQKTLIVAGLCMSYDETINDTVVGKCAFNYHNPDAQIFSMSLYQMILLN